MDWLKVSRSVNQIEKIAHWLNDNLMDVLGDKYPRTGTEELVNGLNKEILKLKKELNA